MHLGCSQDRRTPTRTHCGTCGPLLRFEGMASKPYLWCVCVHAVRFYWTESNPISSLFRGTFPLIRTVVLTVTTLYGGMPPRLVHLRASIMVSNITLVVSVRFHVYFLFGSLNALDCYDLTDV